MTFRGLRSLVGSGLVMAWFGLTAVAQTTPATPDQKQAQQYVEQLEKQIAGKENQPAETVFKNIQLFKGFPATRVLRIMQLAFVGSVGVDCTHCHTAGEWERDDKEPKVIARKMWTMMTDVTKQVGAIKKGAVVNCYTCHRGSAKPALSPPRG